MDVSGITTLIQEQGEQFKAWDSALNERIGQLEKDVNKAFVKLQRPDLLGNTGGPTGDERKALDAAYRAWIRGDQAGVEAAVKTMQVGSGPDGGYFKTSDKGEIVRIMAEVSPLLGMVRDIPLKQGDALEGVLDRDSFDATWVGEVEDRPDTDAAQVGAYRIPLNEIYSCPKLSQKLIDCADIDVVEWATAKIAESFAVAQEAAIISGGGITQPRGFTTFPTVATGDATRAWGTFEHVVTGADGAFHTTKSDPLLDLASKLRPIYRRNASWLMSRSTAALIRKMKVGTTDEYLWQPGLQAGQPDMLLGFPVAYSEALPALATASLSIALGDFQAGYWTVRRPGVKLLADPFTAKPHVRLYAYSRLGGAPVNFEAIKLLKFSSA